MSLVYLKNKKNGVTYVYECQSFWNKEKKKPDSIRSCIGKLHPDTKELIPSKNSQQLAASTSTTSSDQTASIRSIGAIFK